MRWKRLTLGGQAAVGKPGPKRVQPLNLSQLKQGIQGLDHGSKRSRATGPLHRTYGGSISRRDLNAMVRQVRDETNQRRCAQQYRVTWLRANLAWAKEVAIMLKAIHAGEDRQSAMDKAEAVAKKLEDKKLHQAAAKVKQSIHDTLTYYDFPSPHWRRIRTNNPLERILREVRRRTRVVGSFPDGNSALMLVAARLRHIAGTRWKTKRYLDTDLLRQLETEREEIAA